jgi:ornithine--oxo-acid transaminase
LKTIGFDREYVAGRGAHLFDAEGHRYLDCLAGWGVFGIGRNHPALKHALHQVIEADLPNLVQMDVSVLSGLLARRLVGLIPGAQKVFFCNSGAEAVEAAMKFARAATRRPRIIHCEHAFHGLTFGALSLNGDPHFRSGFEPLLPGCDAVPFDDLAALERALASRDVAAFVVEPIQGKGVQVPSPDYLPGAAQLCRRYGTLLVADEIQTGLGRTGTFLAIEHSGIEPDMVLLAKALSGGHVPVGAVALKSWIFERVFDRMDRAVVHGSTFGKNDLAMAAGLATLDVIKEEGLVQHAAKMGEAILTDLRALAKRHSMIHDVRGRGLLIGVEFGPPVGLGSKAAWALLSRIDKATICQMITIPLLKEHRILCQVAGHGLPVIKLIPPLVIGEGDRVWLRDGFDRTLEGCRNLGHASLKLIQTLAAHTMKPRAEVGSE